MLIIRTGKRCKQKCNKQLRFRQWDKIDHFGSDLSVRSNVCLDLHKFVVDHLLKFLHTEFFARRLFQKQQAIMAKLLYI